MKRKKTKSTKLLIPITTFLFSFIVFYIIMLASYSYDTTTAKENVVLNNFEEKKANLNLSKVHTNIKEPEKLKDQRVTSLEKYLEKYKSPLSKHADLIIELSDYYGIDYKIPVAIAGIESGFCKINFKPNNCWGYGNHSWSDLETAIKEYLRLMNKYYFTKGRKDIYSISKIYNPNYKEYTQKVLYFINQIP